MVYVYLLPLEARRFDALNKIEGRATRKTPNKIILGKIFEFCFPHISTDNTSSRQSLLNCQTIAQFLCFTVFFSV